MDPFTLMLMMSLGNRRRGARNFCGSGKSSKATKMKRLEKRRATSSGSGSELICEDELLEMEKGGMLRRKLNADYNLAQLKEICIRNKIPRSGAKYEVCA